MTEENNMLTEINKIARVLLNIIVLAFLTYLFMKLISPYSKALGRFLFNFALGFILVTLLALYLKYIVDLYKQIRSYK